MQTIFGPSRETGGSSKYIARQMPSGIAQGCISMHRVESSGSTVHAIPNSPVFTKPQGGFHALIEVLTQKKTRHPDAV